MSIKEYPKLVKMEDGTKKRVTSKAEEDALEGKATASQKEEGKKEAKKAGWDK